MRRSTKILAISVAVSLAALAADRLASAIYVRIVVNPSVEAQFRGKPYAVVTPSFLFTLDLHETASLYNISLVRCALNRWIHRQDVTGGTDFAETVHFGIVVNHLAYYWSFAERKMLPDSGLACFNMYAFQKNER